MERVATTWSWAQGQGDTTWSWAQGQGQRDMGTSCGQGMDRLGLLLCSSSTSSCNSCDAFVPSALHAQQQEQLATMREPLSRRRSPGAGASERSSD